MTIMITLGLHTGCIGGIFIMGIFGNFYTKRGGGIFDFQNGNSRWPCLRCGGIFSKVLLQIFFCFWQWNNFENQLIFGKVKAYRKKWFQIFWATLYLRIVHARVNWGVGCASAPWKLNSLILLSFQATLSANDVLNTFENVHLKCEMY